MVSNLDPRSPCPNVNRSATTNIFLITLKLMFSSLASIWFIQADLLRHRAVQVSVIYAHIHVETVPGDMFSRSAGTITIMMMMIISQCINQECLVCLYLCMCCEYRVYVWRVSVCTLLSSWSRISRVQSVDSTVRDIFLSHAQTKSMLIQTQQESVA